MEAKLIALLMTMMAALSVAADKGNKLRVAILPRKPFGIAEQSIAAAFGEKLGLKVEFTYLRSAITAAEMVINGSVDIASSGIMTSFFLGKKGIGNTIHSIHSTCS